MGVLRFPADESCDHAVVRALRAEGHDVLACTEEGERTVDAQLIVFAREQGRIMLTEDKDFGWLVFASQQRSAGVILIRFPGNARSALVQSIVDLVRENGASLSNSFAIVEPGSVRIAKHP